MTFLLDNDSFSSWLEDEVS